MNYDGVLESLLFYWVRNDVGMRVEDQNIFLALVGDVYCIFVTFSCGILVLDCIVT